MTPIATKEELTFIEQLFTPLVSDTMDRLGIAGCVLQHDIQSIPFDPALKVAGIAFPCRVIPTTEYVEIHTLLEMVDAVPEDSVVLVAADSDTGAALWGGLMSTRAKARGARGAIVNGGIRDFEQIAGIGFPVFGTNRCVKDIRRRGYMAEYNIPVTIGGVLVNPGDVVFGDANGVVVIHQEDFPMLIEELRKTAVGEMVTAAGLKEGRSATELFKEFQTF
jgi:4-hydroxy-4-methyl-2-oxoglutarate aldolase